MGRIPVPTASIVFRLGDFIAVTVLDENIQFGVAILTVCGRVKLRFRVCEGWLVSERR